MTLYDIKPQFQNLLRPLVVRLHARGVTANQITLLAMLTSVLLGGWLICFRSLCYLFRYLFFCSSAWRSMPSTAC